MDAQTIDTLRKLVAFAEVAAAVTRYGHPKTLAYLVRYFPERKEVDRVVEALEEMKADGR
jgi:hypothetical protein